MLVRRIGIVLRRRASSASPASVPGPAAETEAGASASAGDGPRRVQLNTNARDVGYVPGESFMHIEPEFEHAVATQQGMSAATPSAAPAPTAASIAASAAPVPTAAAGTSASGAASASASASASAPAAAASSSSVSASASASAPAATPAADTMGFLWFSNMYPSRLFKWDARQRLARRNHELVIPGLLPEGVEVVEMVPRMREGGVFVSFRATPGFVADALSKGMSGKSQISNVCRSISQHLRENEYRAPHVSQPVRAYRVEGRPFFEDIESRFPSNRLRVDVHDGALALEDLYDKLRKYGRLVDLALEGKQYVATYRYTAAAISARNCLHRAHVQAADGHVVSLAMDYQRLLTTSRIAELYNNHPRIMLPASAAVIASASYLIVDPMREFFVRNRIAGTFRYSQYALVRRMAAWWLSVRDRAVQRVVTWRTGGGAAGVAGGAGGGGGGGGVGAVGDDGDLGVGVGVGVGAGAGAGAAVGTGARLTRVDDAAKLEQWLAQVPSRVLLLTGPRGSGKSSLIRRVAGRDGPRVVYINVRSLLENAQDEDHMVRELADALGYMPNGANMKSVLALLDAVMPGAGKSAQSGSKSQVASILQTATRALASLREASQAQSATEYAYPLFVFDGFTIDNKDRFELLAALAHWASYVTDTRLARVVFVADSSFGEEGMANALASSADKLDVLYLGDAPLEDAATFLRSALPAGSSVVVPEALLSVIGGRFVDLLAFAQRIRNGVSPEAAVEDIVGGAALIVRSMLLGTRASERQTFTPAQLWQVLTLLAHTPLVRYDDVLFKIFRGQEAALRALVSANVITIAPVTDLGGSRLVQAGSPVYLEAFRRLAQDKSLRAGMDLQVAKLKIAQYTAEVRELENELETLAGDSESPSASLYKSSEVLVARRKLVVSQIAELHDKLAPLHEKRRACEAALDERLSAPVRIAELQ